MVEQAISIAGVETINALGRLFGKKSNPQTEGPKEILPPGWQFYSKPTTLEPPGTVFRIESDKQKYIVDILKIETIKGEEAFGKVSSSIQANSSVLAQFLGIKLSLGAKMGKSEQILFEVNNPVREISTDIAITAIVDPFIKGLDFQAKNRYFIIREVTSVDAINFRLTHSQVNSLGGEATLKQIVSVKGSFSSDKEGNFVLKQRFTTPMRIMFLPQEIKPVSFKLGGAGPRLGLVPVTEPLEWYENQ